MEYKYAKEQTNYSDYASGRVFYSVPGHPAFPVRLASEIFQRCVAHRQAIYQIASPCVLYDPCCGTAYHLSVLAFLHRQLIQTMIASDVDEKAVSLAEKNLSLLTMPGLESRIAEIKSMLEQYGKDSHKEALKSAAVLKTKLPGDLLATKIFQANVLDKADLLTKLPPHSVDLVFTDIPYGQHSDWHGSNASNPLWSMLDSLLGVLSSSSIVAVVSDKAQKAMHEGYGRIEQFQVGKRRIAILRPV
jgi:23S rRNA (guanine2535-N1)-methyltransferase